MAIHIRRREFIVPLGSAVATCPLVARAQQGVRVLRLGFVGGQPPDAEIYIAVRKRMAELGYRDRYFTFEYIQTPTIDAYDASFRELVARKPDIVMAAGNEPALRAARAAAGTLPIVFLAVDFAPVERGYVARLARPGGNITGIFVHPLELAANASSWYVNPSRERATLGSSGTPRPAIRLRPRQWQPNPSTSNRGALR